MQNVFLNKLTGYLGRWQSVQAQEGMEVKERGPFWSPRLKIGLLALAAVHLLVALSLMINHVRHVATVSGSDSFMMDCYHQVAEGGHGYHPRNDIAHIAHPYTPLTSGMFGLSMRLLGPDIRWIRL